MYKKHFCTCLHTHTGARNSKRAKEAEVGAIRMTEIESSPEAHQQTKCVRVYTKTEALEHRTVLCGWALYLGLRLLLLLFFVILFSM